MRHQFKILGAIIGWISIFVMNNFITLKRSAENLFHHAAMFIESDTLFNNADVSFVDIACTFGSYQDCGWIAVCAHPHVMHFAESLAKERSVTTFDRACVRATFADNTRKFAKRITGFAPAFVMHQAVVMTVNESVAVGNAAKSGRL